jgi:hypothetical protein
MHMAPPVLVTFLFIARGTSPSTMALLHPTCITGVSSLV